MKMKVKPDTIIRTIVLIVALCNQALAIFGREQLPITDDQVYQIVTLIITIVTSLVTWWKNNSFTQAALHGDVLMKKLKAEGKRNGNG